MGGGHNRARVVRRRIHTQGATQIHDSFGKIRQITSGRFPDGPLGEAKPRQEQVAKHYRKMSILIHPDKCKHEKAADAFQILADAFAKVKDPATKDKYSGVIDSARERVRARHQMRF